MSLTPVLNNFDEPGPDSLDAALDEVGVPARDEGGGYLVHNEMEADWVLRKIARHEAHIADVNLQADTVIQRVEDWRKREVGQAQGAIDWFTHPLRSWVAGAIAGMKKKTANLISGSVGLHKQVPEVVRDDELLLKWLTERGMTEFIILEPKINWQAVKPCLKLDDGEAVWIREGLDDPTGEVLKFIRATPRPDKLVVKTATPTLRGI